MEAFLEAVAGWGWGFVLAAIFGASYLEHIVPLIPSDVVVIFGGYLAGVDAANGFAVYTASVAGSFAGFATVYWLGWRYGTALLESRLGTFLGRRHTARAGAWLERFGPAILLTSRFLAGLRAVLSLLAGAMGLGPRVVLPAALVGIVLWNGLVVGAGVLAGVHWRLAVELLRAYSAVVFAALVLAALGAIAIAWLRRRRAMTELTAVGEKSS